MNRSSWQVRLLPFVLIAYFLFSVVYIFFFYYEIRDVQAEFATHEDVRLVSAPADTISFKSEGARLELLKWKDRVRLEYNAMNRRYSQGRMIIMGRLKLIFFSFALGSFTFLIGAIFILSRIVEDPSEIGIKSEGLKAQIRSGSPGIILVLFGTIIVLVCIIVKTNVSVTDEPLYIPYPADLPAFRDTIDRGIPDWKEMQGVHQLPKAVNDSINRALK